MYLANFVVHPFVMQAGRTHSLFDFLLKAVFCAILFTLLPAWLTACRRSAPDRSATHPVVDSAGNEVQVPLHVTRIATLAPGVTEIVAAAGGLDRLVGVSNADDFPPSVESLPEYSALPINFEAVAALNPDLVLGTDQVNDYRAVSVFGALGIAALFLPSSSIDEVLSSIETVGDLLGTTRLARSATDSLRARVDALTERSRSLRRPRVLFLISVGQLHSFGPESYVQDLIELAGGRSITADLTVENPILSDEFVLSREPDIIVGTLGPSFDRAGILAHHPTWIVVPAIRDDRVYSIDGDLILRAGPRIVDGAERLFELFHPEVER